MPSVVELQYNYVVTLKWLNLAKFSNTLNLAML